MLNTVEASQIYGSRSAMLLGLEADVGPSDFASGSPREGGDKSPAMVVVTVIVLLVIVRLLYEFA